MRTIFALVVAVLMLAACASARADEWTTRDTAMELVFASTLALDYSQTVGALRAGGFQESNPLLGHHPSALGLAGYNVGGLVLHAAVAAALPRPYREIWQAAGIGMELGAVGHNLSVGARLTLPF